MKMNICCDLKMNVFMATLPFRTKDVAYQWHAVKDFDECEWHFPQPWTQTLELFDTD